MPRTSPTRMNLILLKKQITLADSGVVLLKSKREALLKEFLSVMDVVLTARDTLKEAMRTAQSSLAMAMGYSGRETLVSASFAAYRGILIDVIEKNVWGVTFPEVRYQSVHRPVDGRGYSLLGTHTATDEVAERYENVVDLVLRIASQEMKLKRLGEEIRKVSRRINALEERVLPELRTDVRFIRGAIEQREREDLFRMKRMKGKKQRMAGRDGH